MFCSRKKCRPIGRIFRIYSTRVCYRKMQYVGNSDELPLMGKSRDAPWHVRIKHK